MRSFCNLWPHAYSLWWLQEVIHVHTLQSGVKISKKCKGPLKFIFWEPAQSFKGPDLLIFMMGLITVSLSPQNLRALQDRRVLILRARKEFWPKEFCGPLAQGPALFEPLHPIKGIFSDSNITRIRTYTSNKKDYFYLFQHFVYKFMHANFLFTSSCMTTCMCIDSAP